MDKKYISRNDRYVFEIDTQDISLKIGQCCKKLNELRAKIDKLENELQYLLKLRSVCEELLERENSNMVRV